MSGVFLHDWAEDGMEAMMKAFGLTPIDLAGARILFATYSQQYYEGDAFVLFARGGKLYEVNASH